MNTKSRFKIYLVLILLTGVGLALALPALAPAHASTRGDPLAPSAADDIIYVAKSGDGSDGLSWTTAFTDLQDALAESVSGGQIWVAKGVYTPGTIVSDSFQLVEGVAVYGGFDPAEGVDQFGERDWERYPTILSGDIGGDDVTSYYGVVLTTTDIVGDNSYHVVTADGTSTPITGSTVLDGFTITAGQANSVLPDDRGGGYNCEGSGSGGECSPSLRNITFSGNSADIGGAMYNDGSVSGTSSPSLTNVIFSGNSADYGGAINNNGEAGVSNPSLDNVTFSGNSAADGGAIYNYGHDGTSSPSLSNVTFSGNHATNGGAMYSNGSASGASSPSLRDVTFSGNSAGNDGGAMYNDGYDGTSSPSLRDVTFAVNSAGGYGGAVYNYGELGTSSPSLANVIFSGNEAYNGGAMFNDGSYDGNSSPSLRDVTFAGNSAGNDGEAMVNDGEEGTSSPALANVTLSGNSAGNVGGAMYNTGYDSGTSNPSLSNVILWGNTADINGSQMYNSYASVAITTSLVQGGLTGSGVYNNNGTVIDGGGNLDANPYFIQNVDPSTAPTTDGNLRLLVASPAIDSGTNSANSLPADLDGNPRVVDGDGDGDAIVDMGAYEYNCPAGNILYVDHTASGVGSSWLDAKADLALGLKLLSYCPDVSQVWVATGVYTPGAARSDSFDLVPGVALYGGFDPEAGADQFGERDWGAYPTILSGDIGGNDTTTNGVVLTTTHIVGGNSYHVVTANGSSVPITGTTLLDGFTITAGQANGGFPDNQGGGYYCGGSGIGAECSPSLRNVTFSGNHARFGGAMYNNGYDNGTSNPSLSNVTFSGNSAGVYGGAMYNDGHDDGLSSPSLRNVTFSGNSAGVYGGAMYNYGIYDGISNPSLRDVTFSGNSAGLYGGAMYNYGEDGSSSPTLTNVTFSGNSAGYNGGAMYNDGSYDGNSSPKLVDVTFTGNSAGHGGAMYNYGDNNGDSRPSLRDVTFSGNSAEHGGAMYNGFSRPSLVNVTFAGNSAANEGGAMFNRVSSPSLVNVILWGNTAVITGSQLSNSYGSVDITTSLVQGGLTGGGVYNENSTVTDGGGNLDDDPEFLRDPDPGPDGDWDGVDDDYGVLHLQAGSPAIDTGSNDAISLPTDLDGHPRVVDGDLDGTATVDMGAYEFQTYPLYVPIVFR